MPPSRFVTGRRFFNTDRPSDFVPMAFIIYTCARYPQTQARAHNRASIDEEKFVEAENKKKKRRRRKEIEERKVKLRRGSVIERFCFCSFFFFFEVWCFLRRRRSNRLETGVAESRKIFTIQPLQLDDVPFFFFYSFKSTWKTYNRRTYCIFQNQSEFGSSFAKCFAM